MPGWTGDGGTCVHRVPSRACIKHERLSLLLLRLDGML